MSDNEIATLANKIIDSTMFISRFQLSKKIGVTRQKLVKLHEQGLIPKLARPCTKSMSGTLSRAMNPKFGQHLRLPGTPKF
jgi:hypothetical protein